MRLLPFLRSYASLPAPASSEKPPQMGEAGSDTIDYLTDYATMLGGSWDINPELTGSAKFRTYDEMRKTSASVKSLLMYVKLPVRAANWGLNPAVDDPVGRAVCDFVAWNLGLDGQEGQLDLSWDGLNQQALTMLDFGPVFEELVWDDPRTWTDADGDDHLVLPLRRLAPRSPLSIMKVETDRGRIVEVTQWAHPASPMPGSKLSYMVFEPDGNRWDGISLLRAAYGPWRLQKALMIAAGIGWDRFASGTPVVYHPDNVAASEKAAQIGRNLRQHERGYVTLPVDDPGGQFQSWRVELLNGSTTLADPTPLLNYYDNQIASAGIEHFSRQGMAKAGARAAAMAQADPFYLGEQAIADYIRRERGRQLLKKIVAVNFGQALAETHTPKLTVSNIQARNVETVSQAIEALAAAGFTFTDRDAVDDIRELLGFPKLPNDLEQAGIPRDQLLAILQKAGLDPASFAAIVNALPPELGVAKNTVIPAKPEGSGLVAA